MDRWGEQKIPVRLPTRKKTSASYHEGLYPKLKHTFSQKMDVIAIRVYFWDSLLSGAMLLFREGMIIKGSKRASLTVNSMISPPLKTRPKKIDVVKISTT